MFGNNVGNKCFCTKDLNAKRSVCYCDGGHGGGGGGVGGGSSSNLSSNSSSSLHSLEDVLFRACENTLEEEVTSLTNSIVDCLKYDLCPCYTSLIVRQAVMV